MLEEKETYTIKELFRNLDKPIRVFAKEVGINEVTLARIRDGKPTYSSTANKLINKFAEVYDRPIYLDKVTGITISEPGAGRSPRGRKSQKPAEDQKGVA